jgi:hypothetical protein
MSFSEFIKFTGNRLLWLLRQGGEIVKAEMAAKNSEFSFD